MSNGERYTPRAIRAASSASGAARNANGLRRARVLRHGLFKLRDIRAAYEILALQYFIQNFLGFFAQTCILRLQI